jgi:5'-nucleotidase (lipoprotein e(P4) family)
MVRTRLFAVLPLVLGAVIGSAASSARTDTLADRPSTAASERATLWLQTSAEYRSLARASYNAATETLKRALKNRRWTAALEQKPGYQELPPAVILDVDETALDNTRFQASVVKAVGGGAKEDYYPDAWDEWVALKQATAVPGAPEFVWAARALGIEVYFITNRECKSRGPEGPVCPQEEDTLENLAWAGFPPTDSDHLLLKGEQRDWTSEKSNRRGLIATRHRILMLVGDDLGDFLPGAKTMSLDERTAQAKAARERWGTRWVILPNPVYGSWLQALGKPPVDQLAPVPAIVEAIERATNASCAPIRVVTWNMNNLHSVIGEPLRDGAPVRSAQDYEILKKYADRLDADIIAVQRVQPVARARYAASGMLKSGSLAAYPESRRRDSRWMRNAVNSSQRPLR